VFIKTLGKLEFLHHWKTVIWDGGGAGKRQLRRILAYLVVYRGRWVTNLRLLDVSRKRHFDLAKPKYLITGIAQFLKRYDLSHTLQRDDESVVLHQDPAWATDTDVLQAGYHRARELLLHDDRPGAIALLDALVNDDVVSLGQEYMIDLRQHLPDDAYLHTQAAYWRNVQRNAIWLLVEQLLAEPPTNPHQRDRPLDLAHRALGLERPGAFDYRMAARAADLAEMHDLAATYRQQADAADAADAA